MTASPQAQIAPERLRKKPAISAIPTDLARDKSVRACLPPGRPVAAPTQAGAA
jgi:hypothetical protein